MGRYAVVTGEGVRVSEAVHATEAAAHEEIRRLSPRGRNTSLASLTGTRSLFVCELRADGSVPS